jgi:hypothetical protein
MVVVGALSVVVSAFLPWVRSGRVDRSSFALVAVVDRLGVLDGSAATAARGWYAVPALGGVVLLAAATRRDRLAVAVGTLVALAGVGFAVAVHRSPLTPRPGASVTIGGAAVVGAGLVIGLVAGRGGARTHE